MASSKLPNRNDLHALICQPTTLSLPANHSLSASTPLIPLPANHSLFASAPLALASQPLYSCQPTSRLRGSNPLIGKSGVAVMGTKAFWSLFPKGIGLSSGLLHTSSCFHGLIERKAHQVPSGLPANLSNLFNLIEVREVRWRIRIGVPRIASQPLGYSWH
jgi:hypothetical protein